MRINAGRRMWQFFFTGNFFRELAVRTIAFQRGFADKTAAFDAEVLLRNRKRIRAADLDHLHAVDPLSSCDSEVRIGSRAQKITIEASLLGDARPFFQVSARVWQFVEPQIGRA